MIVPVESTDELDARQRLGQLRREIEQTTRAYQVARERRQYEDVTNLLRKRSELVQSLFQTQRELLELLTTKSTHPPLAVP